MPVAVADATVGDPALVVVAVCFPLIDAIDVVVPAVFTAVGADPEVVAVGSVRLILAAAQKDCANARVSVGPCAFFRISRVPIRRRDCSSGESGDVFAQRQGRERYRWWGRTDRRGEGKKENEKREIAMIADGEGRKMFGSVQGNRYV